MFLPIGPSIQRLGLTALPRLDFQENKRLPNVKITHLKLNLQGIKSDVLKFLRVTYINKFYPLSALF